MQQITHGVSISPVMHNQAVTMSSREIAGLTGSLHANVKRSAERLVVAGILTYPLDEFPFEHNGNTYTEYRFNKRDSLVLVARLSPEFTAKIVDRWQELEEELQPKIPQSYTEALRLAADLNEQLEEKSRALELAAPKAEFVDRYVDTTGSMTFRQVCKLLKIKEPEFRLFLQENKIMYRLNGSWAAYQCHIDAGRFEIKTGTSQTNNHSFAQARFTPKGVKWIAGLWGTSQVEGVIA
ncbi:phage antirepressor KilAC domain-containing protein [Morganella morganii]|uniref:phage antirepressor KilAC domain-containing protein n=1 Tax=Morganella morganii TaxID=582 RepID=UPI00280C87CE|nr:phage antirepressor KilAC domain-containing protein [Morganella morganii subsp. morganii]HEI8437011.1 phage antirepressor KilAC domain-containing protein [Morganella morganii]